MTVQPMKGAPLSSSRNRSVIRTSLTRSKLAWLVIAPVERATRHWLCSKNVSTRLAPVSARS
jgi:hypothetical protein